MPSTIQLNATPKDASSNSLSGRVVSWSSDAPSVASVSGNGFVSGLAVGVANITASCEGKVGTCVITVVNANTVAQISLTPGSATVGVGATLQLVGVPEDSSGNPVAATIAWSSSDATKASVDQSGLVTGVAQGAAQVTAAVGVITAQAAITVPSTATVRQMWWEADTLALVDQQSVTSWLDQVASVAASESINFNKPKYLASSTGGLPAVEFDLNGILQHSGVDAVAWTRYIVARLGTSTPTNDMYLFRTPGFACYVRTTGVWRIEIIKSDSSIIQYSTASAAVSLNTPHVFEVSLDGSAITNVPVLRLDGTIIATTLTGGTASGTRHTDAGASFFGGDSAQVHEILGPLSAFIKTATATVDTAERQRLGTKYGITVS